MNQTNYLSRLGIVLSVLAAAGVTINSTQVVKRVNGKCRRGQLLLSPFLELYLFSGNFKETLTEHLSNEKIRNERQISNVEQVTSRTRVLLITLPAPGNTFCPSPRFVMKHVREGSHSISADNSFAQRVEGLRRADGRPTQFHSIFFITDGPMTYSYRSDNCYFDRVGKNTIVISEKQCRIAFGKDGKQLFTSGPSGPR